MPIVAGDLKFFASERMIDNLSTVPGVGGGGYMSQTQVVDGAQNNVFPDVMPGDRVAGMVQLRQVYPIVLSADNAAMSNAAAGVTVRPSDANVEIVAFSAAGTSSAAADAEVGTKWTYLGNVYTSALFYGSANGGNDITANPVGATYPPAGSLVRLFMYGVTSAGAGVLFPQGLRVLTARSGDVVTLDGGSIHNGASGGVYACPVQDAGAGTRVSAVSHTTAGASAADTTLTVDKLWAQVQQPDASTLNEPGEPTARRGQLPLYLPGDVLLIEDGATREAAAVSAVNYLTGVITLTAGLANAFASGSKVTRPVHLGTLQAAANNVLAQQTWTRTWSDALIGASIASRYSGALPVTNDGATTDRWACVFTSATAYNLLSERLGQIGAGSTATNYAPLNPATNQPYFTLLATGWGAGWLPGNVLRFNTQAAAAPIWLQRLVKPGAGSGTDKATLFLRGDVDA